MSDKLVIALYRYDKLVFGQVLEMPEGWRTEGKDLCTEPFHIRVMSQPQLSDDILYVRGSAREQNNRIFYCGYATVDEAIAVYDAIVASVEKINGDNQAREVSDGIVWCVVGR